MKKTFLGLGTVLLCGIAIRLAATEPEWNAAAKGLVGMFPLFIHGGTRRGAPPDAPPGMPQNLVTMETFAIRRGLIHHVEIFPFVTLPYGLGNGWTPGSGR